jgi:hypothetical protein
MFLGILAAIALTAGTVQTAVELDYIDVVNSEAAVVQVPEQIRDLPQDPNLAGL